MKTSVRLCYTTRRRRRLLYTTPAGIIVAIIYSSLATLLRGVRGSVVIVADRRRELLSLNG